MLDTRLPLGVPAAWAALSPGGCTQASPHGPLCAPHGQTQLTAGSPPAAPAPPLRTWGWQWACLGPLSPLWSGGVRRGLASPSPLPPEVGFSSADPVTPRKNGLGVGTAGWHLRALSELRCPIVLRAARKRDSGPGPRGPYTPRQDRGGVQWTSVSALASVYLSAGEQLASKSSAGQMLLPSSGSPWSTAGCGAGKGSAKPRVVSRLHSHSDRVDLQSIKRSPGRQPLKGPAQPP